MEKQISREEIYNGKVIHVVKDEVELDDGTRSIREVVLHNGGACIALKNEGKYYMVSQYRYSLGKEMLEFPAGKIEKGEDPDETILREAVEETGYSVKNIKKLGSIIHLYYGEADEKIGQHFDPDERIDLKRYTYKQIAEMISNGQIDDAKTIAVMYHLKNEGIDG